MQRHSLKAGIELFGREDKAWGATLDIGQISKTHKKKGASRKGAKALKK